MSSTAWCQRARTEDRAARARRLPVGQLVDGGGFVRGEGFDSGGDVLGLA
ncbi:hypothetical protein [Streptomyces sp. NPDC087297]